MNAKKNYIYNVTYNVLSVLTPLITAPYLSRVLNKDGLGLYSYYYAIAYYLTIFGRLGLLNYGTRYIAKKKKSESELKSAFSSIYCLQIISSILAAIVYFIIVTVIVKKNVVVGLVFGVWVVGNIFNIDWLLFGLERFKDTACRSIVVRFAELIMIFVVVRDASDVWKYCLVMSLGYVCNFIIFWDFGKKYLSFSSVKPEDVLQHVKPAIILLLPVIALNIYRQMDKVMLGSICDMSSTGLYEAAEKIIYSLTMFISSLGTVMMPRMSALISSGDEEKVQKNVGDSLVFITAMTSAFCFGVLAVSDIFIPLYYGVNFEGSIVLINLLAVTLILIGWGNVVRTQYIIPTDRDNVYILSISIGAIVNVIVNFILMPSLGAVGACIGTICAELVVPVVQGIAIRKSFHEGKYIIQAAPFVVFGFIMLVATKTVEYILGKSVSTMIVEICVGGVIYLLLSILYYRIFKKESYMYYKQKLNSMIKRKC